MNQHCEKLLIIKTILGTKIRKNPLLTSTNHQLTNQINHPRWSITSDQLLTVTIEVTQPSPATFDTAIDARHPVISALTRTRCHGCWYPPSTIVSQPWTISAVGFGAATSMAFPCSWVPLHQATPRAGKTCSKKGRPFTLKHQAGNSTYFPLPQFQLFAEELSISPKLLVCFLNESSFLSVSGYQLFQGWVTDQPGKHHTRRLRSPGVASWSSPWMLKAQQTRNHHNSYHKWWFTIKIIGGFFGG